MSEDGIDTAFDHLLNVLALVGLPREEWLGHDYKNIQRAREFVLEKRKENREGKREKTSSGDVEGNRGHSRGEGAPSPASGGVRPEGLPVEEGDQGVDAPERGGK